MKTYLLLCLLALFSCQANQEEPTNMTTPELMEKWKSEVRQMEADFAAMAAEQGVPAAFLHFAADDAVLNRRNSAIKGKSAIEAYFQEQTLTDVKLEWAPDFVDVSAAGDMAYTYGLYTFSAKDPEGKLVESEGIFHTVWKRHADGGWKYVWD